MLTCFSAMCQDFRIRTTGLFQGIGQDRHWTVVAVFVDRLGDLRHGAALPHQPERIHVPEAKRIAEDVTEESRLDSAFGLPGIYCSSRRETYGGFRLLASSAKLPTGR